MPGKDGFQVVEELSRYRFNPAIVFITAYDQYAIKAIKTAALDYLLKPVALKDLKEAIHRYLGFSDKEKKLLGPDPYPGKNHIDKPVKINTRTGFHIVHPNEILYIEADGNYSTISLQNNKRIIATINIGKLLTEMPEYIVRISRGAAVNLNIIREIDRKRRVCKIMAIDKELEMNISAEHIREIDKIFE